MMDATPVRNSFENSYTVKELLEPIQLVKFIIYFTELNAVGTPWLTWKVLF